jgi:hypothetical protein
MIAKRDKMEEPCLSFFNIFGAVPFDKGWQGVEKTLQNLEKAF